MKPLLLFFISLIISVPSMAQLTYFDITTPQRYFQKGITALEINLDEYLLFGWGSSNSATLHVNGYGQLIDSLFLGNSATSDAIMLKDSTFILIEGGSTSDWITRYDLQGNQIWRKDLDPEYYNFDGSPRLFNSYDSSFYVLFKHGCLSLCKAKLARVNYNGDSLFGFEVNHFVGDLIQTRDSGFIVAGGETWDTFGDDVIVTRLNANFDTIWTRSYDFGGDLVAATECKVLANGEIIIGGRIDRNSSAVYPGMFLMRISETGDSLWSWSHIEQNHQWDMNGIQSTNASQKCGDRSRKYFA